MADGGNEGNETLAAFLTDRCDESVAAILKAISSACSEISGMVRKRAGISRGVGRTNAFGDGQLEVDVMCDNVIWGHLSGVACVASVASGEKPMHTAVHESGEYSVAYDPLDGSSIIGCNWAVGSIVCASYIYIYVYILTIMYTVWNMEEQAAGRY